ncbi:PAS domain-containing sensor histidine kinase [Salisaeta longa]|uniref:PAS domain-containing sensor histidine kinase n=1 Tax=Salisaeta longa TaxID=503170 RepID=UPI0003B7B96A|nr:PAS domain-containing sensor histidine kinase [Salisaeta longa]
MTQASALQSTFPNASAAAVSLNQPLAVLRSVVDAWPGVVGVLDAEGVVQAWSPEWAAVFEMEGPTPWAELVEDAAGHWQDVLDTTRREQVRQRGTDQRLKHVNGKEYWVDWTACPWHPPDGPTGSVLILTDRTLARQAHAAREQMGSRFDALLNTVNEGVLLMDRRGIFRDCNATAARIFGRPRHEIIGARFNDDKWNGLRPDGTPMPNAEFPFWRAYFMREPIEDALMGIYPPDEPPRWIRVNARPLFDSYSDDPYGVLACFQDVTDQQLKDEALQTSRDLLSSVLTSSLDGILVLAAVRNSQSTITDFECLLANPQAEKMFGRSADDLVGTSLSEELPEAVTDDLFATYQAVIAEGDPQQIEVERTVAQDDEGPRTVWYHVMAVKIEDGVAVTFRDITERKEAAQAMAATNAKLEQRNRALRDFAYVASHDLQEPLRKISAFSNLVLEDYGDVVDDDGRHYLERMQDAAQRMSQLISDLLVYSRVTTQSRPFKPVDLNTVAANVKSDLELRIRDVDGTVDIGPLPTLTADHTQIRQLLQNLIGNGLKFHRPNVPPAVTVRADTVPADSLPEEVYVDTSGPVCRLTVADNGIGFDNKYADRIFSPFKRLHGRSAYEGTGMGLAICRRIVERHSGYITVASVPNEGTTFTVYLPVRPAA